jgi:aspartyl protease family protein
VIDSQTGPALIWGVVMIVVVGSSLIAQRIPVGQFIRYSLAWIAIGCGVYGLVLFRDELGEIWERARADLGGGRVASVRGDNSSIRLSDDGHFWVAAQANGRTVEFLIDSGATTTVINLETAAALGLSIDRTAQPLVVMTANGPINSWPAELSSITVGNVTVEPLAVLVSDVPGSENLLGMNWLNRLGSWRVTGREMVIEP